MSRASRVQRLLLMIAASVVAGSLAGCKPAALQADPETIARGKELYHALSCDRCHGLDAVGSTRTYAPTHNHIRTTAEQRIHDPDYAGKATSVAEYIRESIVDPKAYIVAGYRHLRFDMPSYTHLSERDVDALVQFLSQQE